MLCRMKLTGPLALALAAALTGDTPPAGPDVAGAARGTHSDVSRGVVIDRRGIASLTSWAKAAESEAGGAQAAGNLWLETQRLKRQGANVRELEWQISNLEATVRRDPSDTTAKRHALNNLEYEIQRLRNRQR